MEAASGTSRGRPGAAIYESVSWPGNSRARLRVIAAVFPDLFATWERRRLAA